MARCPFITMVCVLISCLTSSAETVPALSTQPTGLESRPVMKDGASVTISVKQRSISADEQPHLSVRFSNPANDYINLYDVDAYSDWRIVFARTDKAAVKRGPWILKMAKIPFRVALAHRQIKTGESLVVPVNLNDPPFTFCFDYERSVDGPRIAPVRHLSPGTYQVTMTISLRPPFGPGYHEWTGPLTTEPVELIVHQPTTEEKVLATPEDLAVYDAAIDRVTRNLQTGGLWLNGGFPEIKLPKDSNTEDVIDAAVNQTSLESKAYRILRVQPFSRDRMPQATSGSAALLRVGKAYKVVIVFPFEGFGWWSRFYDTEILK